MRIKTIRECLYKYANKTKAQLLSRYFKTGPGEYGEGDIFIGVKVPEVRAVAKDHCGLPPKDIQTLLSSPIHEERLLALVLLTQDYNNGDDQTKQLIAKTYLKNTQYINNWDLVDLSAHEIIGHWLLSSPRNERDAVLTKLAISANLWERRIAIVSTWAFIRRQELEDTFRLAEILLHDKEDLLHKAVGWMLREAGKRDHEALVQFLRTRYKDMPRTMLRYAIERFPEKERQDFLKSRI